MAPNKLIPNVLRIVLTVVGVVLALYPIYLLRKPLIWIAIAVFLAVALSGPVNVLSRRMRRGLAITIVYLGLLAIPVLIGLVFVPPVVTGAEDLANNAPQYVEDIRDYVQENKTLSDIEKDYNITDKLQEEAEKLPGKIPDAAGTLRDIAFSVVDQIFAVVTILVLAAFLLGSGRRWVDAALRLQPADRAARMRRTLERMATAVAGYVRGALTIAFIAGFSAFIVMLILDIPFRGPLAVLVGLFALIPLVGATIAAVIVGIVTLFVGFPVATIVWVAYAIVYQQIENHLIQPQVYKRAVDVHPFVVVVAVLCGGTLLGIVGAILAIPVAASIQIAIIEWWRWRHERVWHPQPQLPSGDGPPPPSEGPKRPTGPDPTPEPTPAA
jgi:predicted PurR-regulated permease PerM